MLKNKESLKRMFDEKLESLNNYIHDNIFMYVAILTAILLVSKY